MSCRCVCISRGAYNLGAFWAKVLTSSLTKGYILRNSYKKPLIDYSSAITYYK